MSQVGGGIALSLLVSTSLLLLEPGEKTALFAGSAPSAAGRRTGGTWSPPDVDQSTPSVRSDITCSLPEVLDGAARRMEELIQNISRFTATEVLKHQEVDRRGKLHRPEIRKFDYMVSIQEVRGGYLNVEEVRNRNFSLSEFPHELATLGTPSLVLIFHPRYIDDFETHCEGLTEWEGQPTWLVHFEQRKNRPNHVRTYHVNGNRYDIPLRGRAWINADTFQITRLETDIAAPIAKIQLRLEHLRIDYKPVVFPGRQVELWLPHSAELYTDFRGHRFYRRHLFTDFELFSVETTQEITYPKLKDPGSP